MTQWGELLRRSLLQGRLNQIYETKFPRHMRHTLCFFIESQDWDFAAVEENKARACFHDLLVYLEKQWQQSVQQNILPGPDFPGMKDYLLKHFQDDPQNLAVILSECLREEKRVLAAASEKQGHGGPAVEQKWAELDNRVNALKSQILALKKEIKSLESLYEDHEYIRMTCQGKVEQCTELAQTQAVVREGCLKPTDFITQMKQGVLQELVNILKQAEYIVAALIDVELPEWKRRQQVASIGGPADTCLDHLQKWFTALAAVLIQVHQQLQKIQEQNKQYNNTHACNVLGETETLALSLFTKLLSNALVVEKQPVMLSSPRPLILKTGVRFAVTVRFLANLPEFKCVLKVKPVFDKDVEEIITINGFRHFIFSSGHSKVLDVDMPGGGLVAEFAHMSLRESKGRTKGSCECRLGVTEELHIIKFVTEFNYAGLRCNIEASSLPVVVLSSTSQVHNAWASVMWCNMSTSEPRNLLLFADPPTLTWQQLSQVLSWQFLSVGQRELDENQLSMLRDKVVDDPDGLIHWNKFSKGDGAWIWIHGILDLIKRHLLDLWRDGCIMGFVSREKAEALLKEKQTGTFLLRFSESNKDGAITFSWVDHSNGETHVHAVVPYTKKELQAMPLMHYISHYSVITQGTITRNPLLYLYPDIHRDTAFGRYCSISEKAAAEKTKDGYIDRTLCCISDFPTPPPSPHQEMHMDCDPDTNTEDQLIQELFPGLLGLPSEDPAPAQANFYNPTSPF